MSCLSTHLVTASDKKTLTDDYYKWHNKLSGLPSPLTDEIRSSLYKRYKKKTGLDPWIKSETPEKTDNHLSQDCVIKISKFPEEKSTILKVVQKRFPFLSYTNSNVWHRDVFKYTDSEAKCLICKESLPESVSNKFRETESRSPTHPNKNRLYQYVIEHGIDFKKFSVITEAEKKR
ncbi:7906_t:CDS:2 [Diversispora eburnea]|uniref:7906_t:CDS:1 n=1 Tax=Diversispora eburnea TaxID=1213867 RepID=A0A9N9CT00_9GLOM|nr:7906_t:CDS:2 [Diversispora eburnea]